MHEKVAPCGTEAVMLEEGLPPHFIKPSTTGDSKWESLEDYLNPAEKTREEDDD